MSSGSGLAFEPEIKVGAKLGDYELVGKLGTGGMATLYLARRAGARGFERLSAVKVMHPHLAEEERLTLMFVDEARTTARIDHPNVVRIEDFGEADGVCFLAMEYVPGCSLAEVMEELAGSGLRLWPPLAVHIAMQLAAGLHGAHETTDDERRPLELVHRDVSPQNILLSYNGHVKLIDFGIAKANHRIVQTKSLRIKGKLGYMAPEQVRAQPVDRRTDVYALAIVLWEMLTMRRYFVGKNSLAIIGEIQNPEVRPLQDFCDVSEALEKVILEALSPAPVSRPKTARAFRKALGVACPEAAALEASDVSDILNSLMREQRHALTEKLPAVVTEELDLLELVSETSSDRPLTESIDVPKLAWHQEPTVETAIGLPVPEEAAGARDEESNRSTDDRAGKTVALPAVAAADVPTDVPAVASAHVPAFRDPRVQRAGAAAAVLLGVLVGVGAAIVVPGDESPSETLPGERVELGGRPPDEGEPPASAETAVPADRQSDQRLFEAGVAHYEEGDLLRAHARFAAMSRDSSLQERPIVAQARTAYVELRLREGREALESDPEDARFIARMLLTMEELDARQRTEAEALERTAAAPPGPAAPARGRGRRRRAPTAPADSDAEELASQRRTERLRECVLRGDNECIVETLRHGTRTPFELGSLIEAYRARGQVPQALEGMRRYVRRYGGTARADAYQRLLDRH